MESSAKPVPMRIRPAEERDASALADLSDQLGYPSTTAQIVERLRSLSPASQHAVLVAESPQGRVIGWVHVSVQHLLECDVRAEVNGLIVAAGQRNSGAGARLLAAAEEWAGSRGCRSMSVRSNVIRERAHAFYLQNGYEHYKTQKAFRKSL